MRSRFRETRYLASVFFFLRETFEQEKILIKQVQSTLLTVM